MIISDLLSDMYKLDDSNYNRWHNTYFMIGLWRTLNYLVFCFWCENSVKWCSKPFQSQKRLCLGAHYAVRDVVRRGTVAARFRRHAFISCAIFVGTCSYAHFWWVTLSDAYKPWLPWETKSSIKNSRWRNQAVIVLLSGTIPSPWVGMNKYEHMGSDTVP